MILNYEQKRIFMHVPKAGGSSVKAALRPHLGDAKRKCFKAIYSHVTINPELAWALMREGWEIAGVTRNPWARVASRYHELEEKRMHPPPWDEWVTAITSYAAPFTFSTPASWFLPEGSLVLKYEKLQKEFDWLCGHWGYPQTNLPRVRDHGRYDWRARYTPKTIEQVRKHFAMDIERWGYEW